MARHPKHFSDCRRLINLRKECKQHSISNTRLIRKNRWRRLSNKKRREWTVRKSYGPWQFRCGAASARSATRSARSWKVQTGMIFHLNPEDPEGAEANHQDLGQDPVIVEEVGHLLGHQMVKETATTHHQLKDQNWWTIELCTLTYFIKWSAVMLKNHAYCCI